MSVDDSRDVKNHVKIGFFLAILGTLLFSFKSIFIKFLYQEGLSADTVLVLRMMLALPVYLVILTHLTQQKKFTKPPKKILFKIILLGFFGYYLASLFDLMGLELITAQLERLTLFTYPFMVAIFAYLFFKESLSKIIMLALVLSYYGLWLVMGEELNLTGNNVAAGVSLVLASAFSFALYVLFSKQIIKQIGSRLFTSIAMIISSLFGLIHGCLVLNYTDFDISMAAWFWLVMLVIFSTVLPSYMMSEALSRMSAVKVGIVGILGPIFTIVLAIYLLGEPFTLVIALGMVLILLGVIITMIKPTS
jgi:drug/metabolite transporter (DMT)-like permease